ncbi:recombinase family protein [Microbacterium sp. ARD31]|uniref:recombinase family protein n=1 Tax=Microbacterium sp. ARD31 TaxID=2962576 RepID=UPI002882102F|nr:recombinase family protein [Microbacterium sp. ARD31]MDT0179934.1 recombinase family protein [Microbacterium sp. ARD31]
MVTTGASPADLVDLYVRLSIDKEGKDSLERQEADLREWAQREGLAVRRVWRDAGRSGYKQGVKRPDFDAAVAAVASGEVGTLAVWKLDRLSRRGAGQVGTVLDAVDAVGGRLFFLKDPLDSAASNSRMLIMLMSELARAESANTSTRVRAKKESSRREGKYLGGPAPWGYTVDENRQLRQHASEALLVRELVDRVLAGDALLAVCRDWNSRGIPTRRSGSEWRPSTLSAALRSPALAGLMPEKRRDETSGKWSTSTAAWRDPATGEVVSLMAPGYPAIVSESERLRLLEVMDGRLRRYGRGMRPVSQPKSLLGGLIKCAACHRPANTFGNSYRCRKWHADGSDCERPLNVSVALIESEVRRAWAYGLASLEHDSPILGAVADHWLAKFDPAPVQAKRDYLEQLDSARARLASADHDYYVRETLDEERHARITGALKDRIAAMEEHLRALPQPDADLGALLDPELSLPGIEAAGVLEARTLLRLAIERVEVAAAPYPGARFHGRQRMRIKWAGESEEDFHARYEGVSTA